MDVERNVVEQLIESIWKIIIPALLGITVKLAIVVAEEKLTFLRVTISIIVGLSFVLLLQHPIKSLIDETYQPLTYGLIAMCGETFGRILTKIYNIDNIISVIYKNLVEYLSNLTGMGVIFKNILSTIIGLGLLFVGIKFEFSDWIRVFMVLLGVILIFSKDTLFSRFGKLLDTVFSHFNKKSGE